MSKVYAISQGSFYENEVVACFSTAELRDVYLKVFKEIDVLAYPEEFEFDPQPPTICTRTVTEIRLGGREVTYTEKYPCEDPKTTYEVVGRVKAYTFTDRYDKYLEALGRKQ